MWCLTCRCTEIFNGKQALLGQHEQCCLHRQNRLADLLEREGRQLLGDGLGSLDRLTLEGKECVVFVEASQSLPIGVECVVVVLLESLLTAQYHHAGLYYH